MSIGFQAQAAARIWVARDNEKKRKKINKKGELQKFFLPQCHKDVPKHQAYNNIYTKPRLLKKEKVCKEPKEQMVIQVQTG